jgi:hypothetical protein
LQLINSDITQGQEAEQRICNYVDSLVSTLNPLHPDVQQWTRPAVHPSKKCFSEISDKEWEQDYCDLLNTVQRYTQCSSAYCLKQADDGTQYCRFGYPIECSSNTHLEFEQVHTKDGSSKYKAKIVTKRNDSRLNQHQQLQLQGWRANCDIQIVIDHHACLESLQSVHLTVKNYQLLSGMHLSLSLVN